MLYSEDSTLSTLETDNGMGDGTTSIITEWKSGDDLDDYLWMKDCIKQYGLNVKELPSEPLFTRSSSSSSTSSSSL